jgi:hypothetical protein
MHHLIPDTYIPGGIIDFHLFMDTVVNTSRYQHNRGFPAISRHFSPFPAISSALVAIWPSPRPACQIAANSIVVNSNSDYPVCKCDSRTHTHAQPRYPGDTMGHM